MGSDLPLHTNPSGDAVRTSRFLFFFYESIFFFRVASLPHHGGPIPQPSPGREQLGPGRAQHRAGDHGDSGEPHCAALLRLRQVRKVPGVCSRPQRLLQEAERSGVH